MQKNDIVEIAVAVAIPYIGAFVTGWVLGSSIGLWYEDLKKPWYTPPNWVFAPVWAMLYTGMGYASYLVWKEVRIENAVLPLGIYALSCILNWAWSPIFFKFHCLKLAAFEIICLWLTVAACIYAFYPINTSAAFIMVPYLGWLTLASTLSCHIAWLNSNHASVKGLQSHLD